MLLTILAEYPHEKTNEFSDNKLAKMIRHVPEKIIWNILNDENLFVKSSAGLGRWSTVPFIAIRDGYEPKTIQQGIYVCYLFSSDMKRVYLVLGQGVQKLLNKYDKRKARDILKKTAEDTRRHSKIENFKADNEIQLAKRGLGREYEIATIFYKKYSIYEMPGTAELEDDLKKLFQFYRECIIEPKLLTENIDFTDFPGGFEEGKKAYKRHLMRERNPRVIHLAKQKALDKYGGLKCEVCDFSFSEKYGEIGKGFIEAHHKKPIAQMTEGEKTEIKDIALICPNCHRMIHTKMPPIPLERLKNIIKSNTN